MKLLIQKFGGTSVKTKDSRQFVIKQIKQALSENHKIIVVVSAIGRNPDPYATESLLKMVDYPLSNKDRKSVV